MFLAEITGRVRRCVCRRRAERGCLGRGRSRVSTRCSRRGRHRLLRRHRFRGKARRWRRRLGAGLMRRTASCIRLELQNRGWPGRGAGGAGRRIPRTPGSRAATGRCAGTRTEVREAASALFLLSAAWAHRDACILAGRGAHVARSPGLSPEVFQAVHVPAAGAWRGRGGQQHRGPRRQLSRPQAQGGRPGFGKGAEGEGTQAQRGELRGPPTRFPGRGRAGRPPRGRGHCQTGRRTQSLHGAALGVAHCGGPGPNGGMPRRPEEPAGQGNIAPRRRGGLCSRAPRARHRGPAAVLRLPPRSRHAALAAAGLLGPRASPAQSVALPAAAFPARPPQRRGGGKQSGRHSRPAGRTPARRPVPGPSGGEGAFRPLGFFLPRWLRRPRYRELPPRCPNTSAAAASPPLIGSCCCDVTQTPPLGRHGPRPHSAHRHTHVDPELQG